MVLTFVTLSFFTLDFTHVLMLSPYNQSTKRSKVRLCFKMDLHGMQVPMNVGNLSAPSLKDSGKGRSFQRVKF